MRIQHVERALARDFRVGQTGEAFANLETRSWIAPDFRLEDWASPGFLQHYNGLLLTGPAEIERVCCGVFPTDFVLDAVLARGPHTLLFLHHPVRLDFWGVGFQTVPVAWLRKLREAGVAIYAMHVPLDIHPAISTSRALARACGVTVERSFGEYHGGDACVYGPAGNATLDALVDRVKAALGIRRVQLVKHHDGVGRVAVVAGGGDDADLVREAAALGCQTYLTGVVQSRFQIPWAEQNNPRVLAALAEANMNAIGGSHYATEAVVMADMVAYFHDLGLPAEFIADEAQVALINERLA